MNNITKVSLAAILFIGISSVVFCQDDLPYKKMHVLYSNEADTIYFVSSRENEEAGKEVGLGFLILLKNNSDINTLFKYRSLVENWYLEYYIGDLNNDKVNELMVLDGDEGFYDIRIYKIKVEGDKILLEKLSSEPFKVLADVIGEPYIEEVDEVKAEKWLRNVRD